jgi:hypothetical protein
MPEIVLSNVTSARPKARTLTHPLPPQKTPFSAAGMPQERQHRYNSFLRSDTITPKLFRVSHPVVLTGVAFRPQSRGKYFNQIDQGIVTIGQSGTLTAFSGTTSNDALIDAVKPAASAAARAIRAISEADKIRVLRILLPAGSLLEARGITTSGEHVYTIPDNTRFEFTAPLTEENIQLASGAPHITNIIEARIYPQSHNKPLPEFDIRQRIEIEKPVEDRLRAAAKMLTQALKEPEEGISKIEKLRKFAKIQALNAEVRKIGSLFAKEDSEDFVAVMSGFEAKEALEEAHAYLCENANIRNETASFYSSRLATSRAGGIEDEEEEINPGDIFRGATQGIGVAQGVVMAQLNVFAAQSEEEAERAIERLHAARLAEQQALQPPNPLSTLVQIQAESAEGGQAGSDHERALERDSAYEYVQEVGRRHSEALRAHEENPDNKAIEQRLLVVRHEGAFAEAQLRAIETPSDNANLELDLAKKALVRENLRVEQSLHPHNPVVKAEFKVAEIECRIAFNQRALAQEPTSVFAGAELAEATRQLPLAKQELEHVTSLYESFPDRRSLALFNDMQKAEERLGMANDNIVKNPKDPAARADLKVAQLEYAKAEVTHHLVAENPNDASAKEGLNQLEEILVGARKTAKVMHELHDQKEELEEEMMKASDLLVRNPDASIRKANLALIQVRFAEVDAKIRLAIDPNDQNAQRDLIRLREVNLPYAQLRKTLVESGETDESIDGVLREVARSNTQVQDSALTQFHDEEENAFSAGADERTGDQADAHEAVHAANIVPNPDELAENDVVLQKGEVV